MSDITFRPATRCDRDPLRAMQALSMRTLAAGFYRAEAVEAFITEVGTLDDHLVDSGTYFVAVSGGGIVGCGGWSTGTAGYSRRLVGASDSGAASAAVVRAVYVHPSWARRGIARRIMAMAEAGMAAAGFERSSLTATLSGVSFYDSLGYSRGTPGALALPGGLEFGVLPMQKRLAGAEGKPTMAA